MKKAHGYGVTTSVPGVALLGEAQSHCAHPTFSRQGQEVTKKERVGRRHTSVYQVKQLSCITAQSVPHGRQRKGHQMKPPRTVRRLRAMVADWWCVSR